MQFSINDIRQAPITNITTATAIVAAPGAGYRIVVVAFYLALDTAGEFTWSSAATALTGAIELAADTPTGMASPLGVLTCAENEALNLTATTAANGFVRYAVVRA